MTITRRCCQSDVNILLVAAISTRTLISGGLSHITPEHVIKMQQFITFTQQQNFGAWRHVKTFDRFRVIWDVTLSLI